MRVHQTKEIHIMLLVKFNSYWADEFATEGFALMSQADYDQMVKYYSHMEASFNFGTNEGFENSEYDKISDDLKAFEVSESDVEVLHRLFPELKSSYSPAFGIFPQFGEDCGEEAITELDELAKDRAENQLYY